MIKNNGMFGSIFIFFLLLSSGCTSSTDKAATIAVNSNSNYAGTFEDLNLGILFDFNFKLYNADKVGSIFG